VAAWRKKLENITENALDEINKNIFFHTSSSDNIGGIPRTVYNQISLMA
jgi:hypothetical protein